jgi:hypothetical protein
MRTDVIMRLPEIVEGGGAGCWRRLIRISRGPAATRHPNLPSRGSPPFGTSTVAILPLAGPDGHQPCSLDATLVSPPAEMPGPVSWR